MVTKTEEEMAKQKEMRKHFIETLYDTLNGVVSPTPYLELREGETIDIKFLNGMGNLLKPDTTEVTVLDIDIASLFFDDFHPLYEGVTGVGKTYTSDAVFNAVFGPDGHYTLRLNGGLMGSSALEPFTTVERENGVPKTRIDPEKCQKYGALFIDEINRGDSQEVFQVVDGVVNLNGDTGYLRVPIPGQDGRYKGLAIIAAMNPADAEHNGARELDIAGENRFLKFKFPNVIAEAGSSQLGKTIDGNLYEKFWNEFSKRAGVDGKWRELYPMITDPAQLPKEYDGKTREFIDTTIGYLGENLEEIFERNTDIIKQGGIHPNNVSLTKDNGYERITELQQTLKHSFVGRDLKKIANLSMLLAFIKGVKNGSYDAAAGLNDVAAATAVILEGKTRTGTQYDDLVCLVNDARSSYSEMHKGAGVPEGYGVRETVWQAAMYAGNERGFEGYVTALQHNIDNLNVPEIRGDTAGSVIRSRILADLVVLKQFSETYEGEITSALKENNAIDGFREIYDKNKRNSSIYEHRLESVIRPGIVDRIMPEEDIMRFVDKGNELRVYER